MASQPMSWTAHRSATPWPTTVTPPGRSRVHDVAITLLAEVGLWVVRLREFADDAEKLRPRGRGQTRHYGSYRHWV
jgi:hypothetical protein